MKSFIQIIFVHTILLFIVPIFANNSNSSNDENGLTVVAVGEAERQIEKIVVDGVYIPAKLSKSQQKLAEQARDVLKNDFHFYKSLFSVELTSNKSENASTSLKFETEKSKGVNVLIRLEARPQGKKAINLKFLAWHIDKEEFILEKLVEVTSKDIRAKTHDVANLIYRSMTGQDSIFKSKIVFVSDRHSSRAKAIKELYIMDFDGRNKKRLTHHRGTVISPAISYDKNKVVYSLISGKKSRSRNVNLYVLNLQSRKSRLLSSRKGINSGAVFAPGDTHIILTLSYRGNAELYSMNLTDKSLRRITKHYSLDVDPSINTAGTLMAFLSGRSGKAMIYTADPTGQEKSVKRISFVGKYNATPRFSPDGKKIVFSSWLDERFDLFQLNSDGSGLVRLTKDFGSNEDPTFSNDGQFIAFSSQRVLSRTRATHNIYIIDKDGDILGNITENFGNCITPRWSK